MLSSVNGFLRYCGRQDCCVKSLRVQRRIYVPEERELTKEEYRRLLEASKGDEQMDLLLQTICATGIRISELRYFTVEAIRSEELTVCCKNKTRTIFLPPQLRKALSRYAARRSAQSPPPEMHTDAPPPPRAKPRIPPRRTPPRAAAPVGFFNF